MPLLYKNIFEWKRKYEWLEHISLYILYKIWEFNTQDLMKFVTLSQKFHSVVNKVKEDLVFVPSLSPPPHLCWSTIKTDWNTVGTVKNVSWNIHPLFEKFVFQIMTKINYSIYAQFCIKSKSVVSSSYRVKFPFMISIVHWNMGAEIS